MADTLIKALLNTVMGMGTVFVVLIFITLIISFFKYIPSLERKLQSAARRRKKSPARLPEKTVQEPKRPVIARPAAAAAEKEPEVDGELIAVLMAAIAASYGGKVSTDSLRIRSVRRVERR